MQNVVKFGWAVSPESARTRTASRHGRGRGDRGETIVSPRNFVSGDTNISDNMIHLINLEFRHVPGTLGLHRTYASRCRRFISSYSDVEW